MEENDDSEVIPVLANETVETKTCNIHHEPTGSSWYVSVFLVVNAALGAGLLNFPAAYHKSGGLVVAISIQAVLIFFVVGSLIILTYCSDVSKSSTYQDVVYFMCGKKIQLASAIAIVLYCFGTCITFFIVIGDQWDKFLTFVYGSTYCDYWYMNRKFTMCISCLLFVLPLCFPKKIDFLKYVSALGVIAIVYCVILVTVKYFVGQHDPGPIRTKPERWTDVFIVVPVICFGYQCHLSIVPIYSCMKKRTIKEFTKTLLIAIALCLFAYTGTASFGYLTFGAHVKEDVLLSYEPTPDVIVAVALIAVKMYTTYPILLFVGRSAVESIWITVRKLTVNDILLYERMRRITIVLIWFITSLLIAIIVPNIGVVISLLGGLAALFAFMFPGLCLLQVLLRKPEEGNVQFTLEHTRTQSIRHLLLLVCCVFYILIGVFIFGLVTTQSIMSEFMNVGTSSHLVHKSICD